MFPSLNRFSTAPPASTGEKASQGVLIGNHSMETLLHTVRADIHPQVERTFTHWLTVQKGAVEGALSPPNALMLAALECTSNALRQYGTNLRSLDELPQNVHVLAKEALALAKESPFLQRCMPPNSMAAQFIKKLDPTKVDFRLDDIARLQSQGFGKGTPFDRIAPEHRWRMCIDPARLRFIDHHMSQASTNPMLPLLFDSEPSYLHGMLNAWSVSMRHLDHPLDDRFLSLLHGACESSSSTNGDGLNEQGGVFMVSIGPNMSPDGRDELLAFARRIRRVVPNYGVTKNPNPIAHMQHIRQLASAPDREALWKSIEPEHSGMVIRSPIPGPTLKALIAELFQDYQTRLRDRPEQTLENIVQLCQELERLHPFGDGNCRTFGVLLMNHLLTRHGLPLTMMDDPNVLDGYLLSECVTKVKEGQERVKQWIAPVSTSMPGPRVRTRLQSRLEAESSRRRDTSAN
ncbi:MULTISPECIES: Fic family protein [Pseudomonas]|uniref:Fic family protein n=1 Tax=Pseudomonas quercus TaxID=2722792 RepID=A0ABX0YKK6_9PSED|nr:MULTISPECIES: Fic family protein [Pseudomonas]MBF7143943.1 Fic family protein [Pseudomonas sp. LY10J]NJP02483.1 Fic family protein [Pseudomonas quercus]